MNETAGHRIGIVGTGMVGASFAYALLQRGIATDIVLVDSDRGRAEGEAMDLAHGLPFVRPTQVRAGAAAELAGSDAVVITAGANQRPGQTRLDLLQSNAAVLASVMDDLDDAGVDCPIVVATNPVDLLTHLAAQRPRRPWGRVIGSGTILDTARLRYLVAAHFEVDPRSVHAYVIGEHGDTAVPVWSSATVGGVPLAALRLPAGRTWDEATRARLFEQTRTAAYEIIARKRATYYAIGLALLRLVEAVVRGQDAALTVSVPVQGRYGVDGIALSLPSIVGRQGVREVLDLPLDAAERDGFARSAAALKDRLAALGPPAPAR